MCTVRYVGLFLEVPLAVPWPVVEHLAVQLGALRPLRAPDAPELDEDDDGGQPD